MLLTKTVLFCLIQEIVAIKKVKVKSFLHRHDNKCCVYVLKELKALKDCAHPNIVCYHESYCIKNKVWIVMEFVDGCGLDFITKMFVSDESFIAAIMKQCLEGLAFIHRKGYIHCDIKSHNIMVSLEGQVSGIFVTILT